MFLKKSSQEFFAKSPFFNLDLQKTRIFLKTHTKRFMFHYQLFYSVQLAFLVLESLFDGANGGVFKKILIFCYFKKMVFLQKILGSIFLQCFYNTFKVVNNFTQEFPCNLFKTINFNKTYMKYTQSLKLLLATVAKSSCVARF